MSAVYYMLSKQDLTKTKRWQRNTSKTNKNCVNPLCSWHQQISLIIHRGEAEATEWAGNPTHTNPTGLWNGSGGQGIFTSHVENISLWLSAKHPASLVSAVLDNTRLSVSIHGILILFLCLGRQGGPGQQEYCECLSSQETEVGLTQGC